MFPFPGETQPEWSLWHPLSLLLLLGVVAGHTALHIYLLNVFLGWPWPRWISRIVRRINTLAIFGGPPLILLTFALGMGGLVPILAWPWFIYLLACAVIGFVIAPFSHGWYLWRHRRPAALESNHSEVLDIARELGYAPIGQGKYRHLALLPRNQIYQVELAEKHLQVPGLPAAWEGLTILHLSDLHFKGIPDRIYYQKVMEHCRRWEPDLVVLTGDVVDSAKHHRWILPVLGKLRWRVAGLAILGNHDKWYEPSLIRRRLRRLGMHVLGNSWQQFEVRGQPLTVIGHEGPWFVPAPDLRDCPAGFRLCLSHTPDNLGWARKNGINLMLSGHTHGGQIRFPLIGSVYVPSKFSRRFDCGTFDENPTLLHVSRGLAGQHPVRYNCRPEVSLLVLHQS